ncbi:Uncharacterised protein [uncultured archaeon]|nr:Uncharacterised protein [uncultured archaeon]
MGRNFLKYHPPHPAHYTTIIFLIYQDIFEYTRIMSIEKTNWIEQAVDRMWGKYK